MEIKEDAVRDAESHRNMLLGLAHQRTLGEHVDQRVISNELDQKLGPRHHIFEGNAVLDIQQTPVENFDPVENIAWSNLENVEHLADGGMCRIFSADFKGIQCVVKTALPPDKNPNQEDIKNALVAEQKVLQLVSHSNIVRYFGSGTSPEGNLFLVLERLLGSLADGMGSKNGDLKKLEVLDAMKWALEVAMGMAYLHDQAVPNKMILHRDLKPDNLGFAPDGKLKVMDLGLAIVVDRQFRGQSSEYQMSGEVGSLRYMAPEVSFSKSYNEKADVYSFTMIFWEMLSSFKPFAHVGSAPELKERIMKGQRPPLNKKWSEDLQALIQQGWDQEVTSRPSFREVVNRLEALILDTIENPVQRKRSLMERYFSCLAQKSTQS